MKEVFQAYFKALKSLNPSEITEHTHRGVLQNLLFDIAKDTNKKIKILHEPKRKEDFGAPDFKVYNVESIIGYVENKKVEENLDIILKREQIKKYTELSENILLTNYIEWIWLRKGEVKRETLCYLTDIGNKKAKLDEKKAEAVHNLIKYFLTQPPVGISKAKDLAKALAVRAKLLKDYLDEELKRQEKQHQEGKLFALYDTFRKNIHAELTLEGFTDAYTQMLIYGLFLSKLNAENNVVTLDNAKNYIPKAFMLIKELVDFIDELDKEEYKEIKWIVEEVLSVMNNLNLVALHESLSFKNKGSRLFREIKEYALKDPYVYFYEDFLSAYDPKLRKAKGVYYTPPTVVNFIIRAIDDLLVDKFKIKEGFADRKKVNVLDFAAGTGTFILEIFKQIFDKLPNDTGKLNLIIKEHLLKNIYGFEYLIGPYAVAHLKLSQFLTDYGYKLNEQERLQIFLTNTLVPSIPNLDLHVRALYEEGVQAKEVKDREILVITGNPPYSGHSQNPSFYLIKEELKTKGGKAKSVIKKVRNWIGDLIETYKFVDGKPLGEKNPKWLQDDYVKFIRFAQDKMDKVDEGIVGIISNHSFLDNPTFRGMRQSLMNSFDYLYFLDLHGNAKKKEKTPEGTKDENVFDIEQGVCISLMVKCKTDEKDNVASAPRADKKKVRSGNEPYIYNKGSECKVYHADFYGLRDEKYYRCLNEDIKSVEWKEIKPDSPFYLFVPQAQGNRVKYEKGYSIKEMFNVNSIGILTARDDFTVQYSAKDVHNVLKKFISLNIEEARNYFKLGEDVRDWKVSLAKEDVIDSGLSENNIIKFSYRPFDTRFTFYTGKSRGFHCMPRHEVMDNFLFDNIALNTSRNFQRQGSFCDVLVSNHIVDAHYCTGISYVFPLYVFSDSKNIDLFSNASDKIDAKKENYTIAFRNFIDSKYSHKCTPEVILGYIYSVLHSPTYRKKYAEFLKIDFPRIPFTDDKKTFEKLSKLGWELVQAHLMNKDFLDSRLRGYDTKGLGVYNGDGDNTVIKPVYEKDRKTKLHRIKINPTQYFENVPEEIYNFHIGGYQVLDKYLKDRKGRTLTLDEIENVENIVKVLKFTIEQMKEIDKLTREWI